jgi:beta-glucosidase
VSVDVKNIGDLAGKEIVQLYVKDVESSIIRPEKELKGFEKIELKPGEVKKVTFTLDKRAFAYYNVDLQDWHVESGEYEILIGQSSKDIILKESLHVQSTVSIRKPFHRNTTMGDLFADPVAAPLVQNMLANAFANNPLANALTQNSGDASEMFAAMMRDMPLRALVNFSQGAFTEEMLVGMIQQLNEQQGR